MSLLLQAFLALDVCVTWALLGMQVRIHNWIARVISNSKEGRALNRISEDDGEESKEQGDEMNAIRRQAQDMELMRASIAELSIAITDIRHTVKRLSHDIQVLHDTKSLSPVVEYEEMYSDIHSTHSAQLEPHSQSDFQEDPQECFQTVLRNSTGFRISKENPGRVNFDSALLHRRDESHRNIVYQAFLPYDSQLDIKSNAKSGRHANVSTWGLLFSSDQIAKNVLEISLNASTQLDPDSEHGPGSALDLILESSRGFRLFPSQGSSSCLNFDEVKGQTWTLSKSIVRRAFLDFTLNEVSTFKRRGSERSWVPQETRTWRVVFNSEEDCRKALLMVRQVIQSRREI